MNLTLFQHGGPQPSGPVNIGGFVQPTAKSVNLSYSTPSGGLNIPVDENTEAAAHPPLVANIFHHPVFLFFN